MEDADTPIRASDYVVRQGLRMVRPYYFDFKCYVKKRWEGKSVIDIFSTEFPARERSYYESAFEDGRLRVEGHHVAKDTPLKNGMCIRHFIHRHEPPVLATPVTVLAQQGDIVAVSKPAGMPVHTAGQYRKNTVLGFLQAHHPELGTLCPTHRLDKPVSGLLLLAANGGAANSIRAALEDRQLQKVYLARVAGAFPLGQQLQVDAPLCWDPKANHASVAPADGPGPSDAKPAVTEFKGLWVAADGRTSLVECRPKTGRTHQIRVHLQHLGHPIANDTQYGGPFGPPLAPRLLKRPAPSTPLPASKRPHGDKRRRTADGDGSDDANQQAQSSPAGQTQEHNCGQLGDVDMATAAGTSDASRGAGAAALPQRLGTAASEAAQQPSFTEFQVDSHDFDPLCAHCPSLPPVNYPIDLHPLWLHAVEYSGPEWSFSCPPPAWAAQEWMMEQHTSWLPVTAL